MDLIELDIVKKLDAITEAYTKQFKSKYKNMPLIDDQDRASMRRLIGNADIKKENVSDLISAYLSLDNEFVKNNGYKLCFLEKNYQAVITSNCRLTESKRYVVALTIKGWPVISCVAQRIQHNYWHPVVDWNAWLVMPFEDRLQGIEPARHRYWGHDIEQWFKTWEYGKTVWQEDKDE